MIDKHNIEKRYTQSLDLFFRGKREKALFDVTDIGKEVLTARMGPDVILDIHSAALKELTKKSDPISISKMVVDANEVLTNSLMGYAMFYYSFMEMLDAKNAELAIAKGHAEESDRLKSIFLATMSHELRTPLNSIIGFTGIMLQGITGDMTEEQKKQLGIVKDSAYHLLALINDVLDISKIEAGELKTDMAPFMMQKAIDATVQTVTPLVQKQGLALHVEVAPEVGEITSDQHRVQQILSNLLSNSIKFTDKGEIKIECQVNDDQIITRVIDTGIGIKPEHMVNLFKPFVQLETGITRRYEGTGLGLSISKKLVESLSGKISAESEFGKGSIFTFTLPIKKKGDIT